ncbi:hypothetical protein KY285_007917 [Solanum tuberosum]|nr:hypothetical protein KY285_007917 [Solanum tuberosum]
MARRQQSPPKHTPKTVIPTTGATHKLSPLTFGDFLPLKYQVTVKENDTSSLEDEIQLGDTDGKDTPKRRLQFSDADMSSQPTPNAPAQVKGNHGNGKTLNFIPPVIKEGIFTVQIEEEDIRLQVEEWENALIRYVIGGNPSEAQMTEFIRKVWGFVGLPKILYHENGYYVFKFQNTIDREKVMQTGQYFYGSKPMILRNWELDFELNVEMYNQIPIWVRFPSLPVGYWSVRALSKLASAIGIPLYTDGITANAENLAYDRVLIEVDLAKSLPNVIVETPTGPWDQNIEYE